MGIKRNCHLSQRLMACVLFVGLLLQSCSNSFNSLSPQGEKLPSINLGLSNNPLINTDKKFVTAGGYLASFYQEEGALKAGLKTDEKQVKPPCLA